MNIDNFVNISYTCFIKALTTICFCENMYYGNFLNTISTENVYDVKSFM